MATGQSYQSLQDQMAQVRQDYGQRVADYPTFEKNLRQQTYGSDTILPTLQQTRDAQISQLWDVDKRLAERYANPQSNMFIADPYKREQLAAGQHQSVLNAATASDQMATTRQNFLGDIIERGVKIFELGLAAKEKEHSMLMDELNSLLATNKATGADSPTLQSVLDMLNGQNGTTTPGTAGLSPEDQSLAKFTARVQSNTVTGPDGRKYYNEPGAQLPMDQLPAAQNNMGSPLDVLKYSKLGDLLGLNAGGSSATPQGATSALTGIMAGGVTLPQTNTPTSNYPNPVQSVTTPLPKTDSEILAKVLKEIVPTKLPNTTTSNTGATGTDAYSMLSSNPALVSYLDKYPDLRNSMVQDLLNTTLYPKQSTAQEWTPAKRQAATDLFDAVNEWQTKHLEMTPTQFYQLALSKYPELTPDEVTSLLHNAQVVGF